MAVTKTLNPQLYDRLVSVFGDVKVCNQGEPFLAKTNRRAFSVPGAGSRYISIQSPGEYYAVCCPVCHETRHRLWINHRWNVGFRGASMQHLAICYNEHCEELGDFRQTLNDMLNPTTMRSVVKDVEAPLVEEEFNYPGQVVLLSSLPKDHGAIRYLRDERGFDISTLETVWGVRWILESDHKLVFDHNRLVVPIYDEVRGSLKMRGWQTRYVDYRTASGKVPNKRTPKYCTQGNASRNVYNLYRACKSDLLVICEGVFDAMRVGPEHGVCTFGKTLSKHQAELIENRFLATPGKRIVFAYDPDVNAKGWEKVVDRVKAWPDVRYLNFPNGIDVADYSQAAVDEMIKDLK